MVFRKFFGVPSWRIQSPSDEAERIKRRMERNTVDGFSGSACERPSAGVFPLVNVGEDLRNYYVYVELPGIKKDDLAIEATGNTLRISGERKIRTQESAKYLRKERETGRFSRIISMPGDIRSEKVEAKLLHGILSITIPKAEMEKPKKVSIQ